MKFFAFASPVLGGMLALSVFTAPAFGVDVVTFSGEPTVVQNQKVYPSATVQTLNGAVPVTLTGKGTRVEFGGIVKVYVASSYVSDVASWRNATDTKKVPDLFTDADRKSLTTAVNAQPVRVLALTMLMNLNGAAITKSFKTGLAANGLSLDTTPGLQDVLNKFNVTLKTGETAVIATFADGSQQQLVVEAQGRSEHVTAPSLGDNFWKIWFAKSKDKDLLNLQQLLVGSAQ